MSVRLALAAALLLPAVLPLATAGADPVADRVAGAARVVEQGAAGLAAACRRDTPADDAQCAAVPLSPAVSEQAVAGYEQSALHRTLALQQALGDDLPLRFAPWIGTHNSFNASAQAATPSQLDANQQLSLTDQLRLDVRSLELDAHWFPSLAAHGASAPVLCHARGADEGHAGCTTERLLVDGLTEVARWLRAHPREVVLLYLEDHLEADDGYAAGARAVTAALGDLLYAPRGAACTPLPLDLSRSAVRAAGKQVVVMSSCHSGAGWNGVVFDDGERSRNEVGPAGYGEDGRSCDPRRAPTAPDAGAGGQPFDRSLVRVFEDSTALSANVDGPAEALTPARVAALTRCAVDITGFDQLLPGDGRLAALVWTWAEGQPGAGGCAVQGRSGRWSSAPCGSTRAVACRTAAGAWSVAVGRCRTGAFAVPRYGWEGVQLAAAMAAAGVTEVAVALRLQGGRWVPLDRR
jgi:hypothetical protein